MLKPFRFVVVVSAEVVLFHLNHELLSVVVAVVCFCCFFFFNMQLIILHTIIKQSGCNGVNEKLTRKAKFQHS